MEGGVSSFFALSSVKKMKKSETKIFRIQNPQECRIDERLNRFTKDLFSLLYDVFEICFAYQNGGSLE